MSPLAVGMSPLVSIGAGAGPSRYIESLSEVRNNIITRCYLNSSPTTSDESYHISDSEDEVKNKVSIMTRYIVSRHPGVVAA